MGWTMRSDSLGDRMKRYESVPKLKLMRRTPVLARIDGKAFHTLTRGMDRPWDIRLQACMWSAANALCKNIQGCKMAYVQSDEISLLLTDWETFTTDAWFGNDLQKMCSVSASIATGAFLATMLTLFPEKRESLLAHKGLPAFDARFWNLPKEEVTNYFIWRQNDAIRNSVQMLARSVFSHRQCNNKSGDDLKEMLLEKGTSWDEQKNVNRVGACVVRGTETLTVDKGKGNVEKIVRNRWVLDENIPVFKEDREYIEGRLE